MRVALVDDHELVRSGLREMLEARQVEVVIDLGPTSDVLQRLLAAEPEVLVLDLSMPGQGGLELLKIWKTRAPEIPVLVLSMHVGEPWVGWARDAGAEGYLSKSAAPDELVAALRAVRAGQTHYAPEVERLLRNRTGSRSNALRLTPREREVLKQIGLGATLTELSAHFVVSRNTAKTHLHNLYRKFEVSDRTQLLLKARSLGLLD